LMTQSNPPALWLCFFSLFLVMVSHGYILVFFLLYQ